MVTREALARLASTMVASTINPTSDQPFDMEDYLSTHGFEVTKRKPWQSKPGGLIYELETCPFNSDHKGGSASFTLLDGKPGFRCQHNSCSGKTITDVFAKFPSPRIGKATLGSDAKSGADASVPAQPFRIEDIPSIWSYDATMDWLIERVIPDGAVTLLCGESGVGKSTLALALAGAVAHGQPFLGRATKQRQVLYVDRENPLAVARERIDRLGIVEIPALKIWGPWVTPAPDGPKSGSGVNTARRSNGRVSRWLPPAMDRYRRDNLVAAQAILKQCEQYPDMMLDRAHKIVQRELHHQQAGSPVGGVL